MLTENSSFASGGVCGSSSEYNARMTDTPAASRSGSAVASARMWPTIRPAQIQPMVPSTRMGANSVFESLICRNAMTLASPSVGMYTTE